MPERNNNKPPAFVRIIEKFTVIAFGNGNFIIRPKTTKKKLET